jgi:hypothetical protein
MNKQDVPTWIQVLRWRFLEKFYQWISQIQFHSSFSLEENSQRCFCANKLKIKILIIILFIDSRRVVCRRQSVHFYFICTTIKTCLKRIPASNFSISLVEVGCEHFSHKNPIFKTDYFWSMMTMFSLFAATLCIPYNQWNFYNSLQ